MPEVADWLSALGMSEYAQRFAENRVDLSVLPDLTDQDLEKLGVAPSSAASPAFSPALLTFVWLSNNGRLAVVVLVAAVFLILFIFVMVGVPRRHRGADDAQPKEDAFRHASGHVLLPTANLLVGLAAMFFMWVFDEHEAERSHQLLNEEISKPRR